MLLSSQLREQLEVAPIDDPLGLIGGAEQVIDKHRLRDRYLVELSISLGYSLVAAGEVTALQPIACRAPRSSPPSSIACCAI